MAATPNPHPLRAGSRSTLRTAAVAASLAACVGQAVAWAVLILTPELFPFEVNVTVVAVPTAFAIGVLLGVPRLRRTSGSLGPGPTLLLVALGVLVSLAGLALFVLVALSHYEF